MNLQKVIKYYLNNSVNSRDEYLETLSNDIYSFIYVLYVTVTMSQCH